MGFKTDDVFGDARFVEQRLDIGQLLRRRGQQARRQRAKPLPQQLLLTSASTFFSCLPKAAAAVYRPIPGHWRDKFMLRAPGQSQPFITQAIEAAPADADNIKPLFFIEAKQRGAYEALAEA